MFPRLRHDRFIRRDHKQHQVDPANAGQHVTDKSLVSRNIDESQPQVLAIGRRQFHMREAKVDGDAPTFFFVQAVRVNPSQSLD